MSIGVVLLIIVILAVFVMVTYNSLTKEKNRIETAEQELLKYEETGTEEDIDNAKKYLNAILTKDFNYSPHCCYRRLR